MQATGKWYYVSFVAWLNQNTELTLLVDRSITSRTDRVPFSIFPQSLYTKDNENKMRQLPGKASKETKKQKRERKKENMEGQRRALMIAVPVFIGFFALLAAFVYSAASKHWT